QDHRFHKAVEAAEQMCRRHLDEIPGADRIFDRLEQSVFADALFAAEHEGVVDFLGRPLHAMSKPADDMIAVAAENLIHVVEPHGGLLRFAALDHRWAVEVETADTEALDPATVRDEAILD